MRPVEYFFWLAGQSFEAVSLFPPAALLIPLGCVGAVVAGSRLGAAQWPRALLASLLPITIPVAILLCGVLFQQDKDVAEDWPKHLIGYLLLTHMLLTAVLVALFRGVRWFVLAASAAEFGYACGAAIMSTMSVTGRWL